MAVPSYSTDLQDVNLAETDNDWSEMTGRTSGGAPNQEDRAFIQGSYSVSQSTGVATGRTVGLQYDYGSNISWTSGWVFLAWQYWQAPKAIGTWADGGMRFGVGSTAGNVNLWNAQGNDYPPSPYGGWKNVAIDPEHGVDETVGSPMTGQYRIFCSAPYLILAVSKGSPHCVDAIRYGRGEFRVNGGESGDYATFSGMAIANDADSARWGLFSLRSGFFLHKGLVVLGYGSAVDFRDANKVIFIDDCPRVGANFNRIEIRQAGSRVDWTNCVFAALGTTTKGQFVMVDNADVNWDKCLFKDMDTFVFLSNASVLGCTFLRCGQLAVPGCDFRGTMVDQYTGAEDTSALVWDVATDPDGYLDGVVFVKGTNAHHAIELGLSSPLSMTLRGITFSGFNAADGQNDSVLHIKRTTGTVTIGCVGCSGTVTYKSDGADVNITQGVSITVHVQDAVTGDDISGARVLAVASSGGPYPYMESVGITRSGSTVTVSHAAHGMATNDWVVIRGCNEGDYNSVWQITKINDDSYSYDIGSKTPDSPATGSPNATFAMIHGTTDGNGNVSDTRTYSADQPFTGRVRKASSPLEYKSAPFSGTIGSASGANLTVQMVID